MIERERELGGGGGGEALMEGGEEMRVLNIENETGKKR